MDCAKLEVSTLLFDLGKVFTDARVCIYRIALKKISRYTIRARNKNRSRIESDKFIETICGEPTGIHLNFYSYGPRVTSLRVHFPVTTTADLESVNSQVFRYPVAIGSIIEYRVKRSWRVYTGSKMRANLNYRSRENYRRSKSLNVSGPEPNALHAGKPSFSR